MFQKSKKGKNKFKRYVFDAFQSFARQFYNFQLFFSYCLFEESNKKNVNALTSIS